MTSTKLSLSGFLFRVAIAAIVFTFLIKESSAFPGISGLSPEKQKQKQKQKQQRAVPVFDANVQHVSTTGDHKFVPPGPDDRRGPCPGLNAMANHGYIPHNGIVTVEQCIQAAYDVFGMGIDLATFISVYSAVINGDLTSFSIGGPPPTSLVDLPGLLLQPRGLSNSHDNFETDVSPTRGDLYEYGTSTPLLLSQFSELYATQSGIPSSKVNYDLSVLTSFRAHRFNQSIYNNPYFFNGVFTGIGVQAGAYTFIYRFMSNKSAEHPEGVLNRDVLKLVGRRGTLGHERIPSNFYKLPPSSPYGLIPFATDIQTTSLSHPQFLSIGGNTGNVNTFTGVDITNLTGGVYNTQRLLEGNNLACFAFQGAVRMAPNVLSRIFSEVGEALGKLESVLGDVVGVLGCPELEGVDEGLFERFPGYLKGRTG